MQYYDNNIDIINIICQEYATQKSYNMIEY